MLLFVQLRLGTLGILQLLLMVGVRFYHDQLAPSHQVGTISCAKGQQLGRRMGEVRFNVCVIKFLYVGIFRASRNSRWLLRVKRAAVT